MKKPEPAKLAGKNLSQKLSARVSFWRISIPRAWASFSAFHVERVFEETEGRNLTFVPMAEHGEQRSIDFEAQMERFEN